MQDRIFYGVCFGFIFGVLLRSLFFVDFYLVQEKNFKVVMRKFGVNRGMLQSLMSLASTFAGMVSVFWYSSIYISFYSFVFTKAISWAGVTWKFC